MVRVPFRSDRNVWPTAFTFIDDPAAPVRPGAFIYRNNGASFPMAAARPSPRPARSSVPARQPPPRVPNRTTNAPPSRTPIIPRPAYRRYAKGMETKNWNAWSQLIGRLPRLHSTEKRAPSQKQ